MSYEKIVNFFSNEQGYRFSRWNKPIAPVVFGVDDNTLEAIKMGFTEVISLTSLSMSDVDVDLGANFMVFFCADWLELKSVPDLNKLVPKLADLLVILDKKNAHQYRVFSFDKNGAITLCILILKYDRELASVSVQTLSMSQMLKSILLWSPNAFVSESPLEVEEKNNFCRVKLFYKALLRASYDINLPDYSRDESHALRLDARVRKYIIGKK